MLDSPKAAKTRVISIALTLSAVLAAALTPVTARVSSRPKSVAVWSSVPLAVAIALPLAWSASQVSTLNLVFALALGAVSAILATQVVIDLCVRRLLRELSYAGLAVLLLGSFFLDPVHGSGISGLLIGALVMTAVTALLVLVSRGALGLGDLHLSPLLGALIGWFSPGAVLFAWMIIAVAGALFTTVGLATKRLTRGTMIPYGPFMVFGTVASVAVIAIRS